MAQFAIITAKRQADSGANFSISLCNETISIKSKYNNLKLNDAANINGGGSGGEDCKYKIRIDIRKLHSVFSALSSIKPTTIYASIGHESVICFYYLNDLISFKIVLPNYDQWILENKIPKKIYKNPKSSSVCTPVSGDSMVAPHYR